MNAKSIATLAAVLVFGGITTASAEDLHTVLRKSGWDRMVGTWVDAETKGKKYKSTTTWRFKDHVIETTGKNLLEGKTDLSIMGYSPKKAQVFHVSADDKGGSSIGQWTFGEQEAILNLGFVTPEKQEGLLQLRYKFLDDDTMVVTVVLPDPLEIKMIRVKEKTKEE